MAFLAFAGPTGAATFVVTETGDPPLGPNGLCSLREAVLAASHDGGVDSCGFGSSAATDTIIVPAGYYRLREPGADDDGGGTGDLDLEGAIAIRGAGALATVIDADSIDRVFDVRPGAVATISGVTITGGAVGPGARGGGIRNLGNLTLSHSFVTHNTAENAGGGIYNETSASVINSTLLANTATFGGGAHSFGPFVIRDSAVYDNTANYSGGGIQADDDGLVATRTVFSGNKAPIPGGGGGNGGGIRAVNPVLTDVTITDNTAATVGGGVSVIGMTGRINGAVVRGNSAGTIGGGIYVIQGAEITNAHISNNSAGSGGGIYRDDPGFFPGDFELSRSTVSANKATDGGGLFLRNPGTLTNVTISGNGDGTGFGGGIFNGGSDLQLVNVTLALNLASGAGTGGNFFAQAGAVQTARNSIFYFDHGAGNCAGEPMADGGHNLAYYDPGETCGFDNAASATLTSLGDHGGPTPTHAIGPGDAALNAGANCPAIDQRGVPRPQGAACDIGAYEFARCLGGIVNRVGTPGKNTMRGGASAEVFLTLGGNDTVVAGGGNDRLCLGAGNDTAKIRGGGKDRAAGEGGRDRVQRDATDVVSGFEVFF